MSNVKITIGDVNTTYTNGSYEINGSKVFDTGNPAPMEVDAFRATNLFPLGVVRFDGCPVGDKVCVGLADRDVFVAAETKSSVVFGENRDVVIPATVRTFVIPERSTC